MTTRSELATGEGDALLGDSPDPSAASLGPVQGLSAAPTGSGATEPPRTRRVSLSVPADPAFVSVLRTTSAGLAARLDLTLDEIEDLRMAVDEAASLVLRGGRPDDDLDAVFELSPGLLTVRVSGPATQLPEPRSVAWAVLRALVGDVEVRSGPEGSVVRLTLVSTSTAP